jgi:hypothetical protein
MNCKEFDMHTIKLDIQDSIYDHVMFLLKSLDGKYINITEYKSDEKIDKYDILEKSAGILANQDIDPLKWQEDIRSEWDEREELLTRLQYNRISSK